MHIDISERDKIGLFERIILNQSINFAVIQQQCRAIEIIIQSQYLSHR